MMHEDFPPNLSHHIEIQRAGEVRNTKNTTDNGGPPGLPPRTRPTATIYKPPVGNQASGRPGTSAQRADILAALTDHTPKPKPQPLHKWSADETNNWETEQILDEQPKICTANGAAQPSNQEFEQGGWSSEGSLEEGVRQLRLRADEEPATSSTEPFNNPRSSVNGFARKASPSIRDRDSSTVEPKESTQTLASSRTNSGSRLSKRPDQAIFIPKRQLEEKAARERAAAEKAERQKLAKEKADREYLQQQEAKRAAESRSRVLSLKNEPRSRGPSPHQREAAWESPNRDVIPNDGWHILEIMGVKATDREEEVLEFLSYILECPIKPYIKWADSTHALAVYTSPREAHETLKAQPDDSRLWLKPYSEASRICREIVPSELQPPTLRPKTTDVVARRLLSSALQHRGLRDVAGEKDLRARQTALKQEKLAAREKRLKDLDEAWGSD